MSQPDQPLDTGKQEEACNEALSGPVKNIYDENLLNQVRAQWQLGDWEHLARLDPDDLQNLPDRAGLAVLAAAGCLQVGNNNEAKHLIHLARAWGVSDTLISRVLIAGIHNSLGRAAAAANDDLRATRHFKSSIQLVAPDSDIELMGHARSVHEMSSLGLLPQASRKVDLLLQDVKHGDASHSTAHTKVLDLEVDILRDRIYALQKQIEYSKAASPVVGQFTEANSLNKIQSNAYHGLHGLDRKLEAYLDYDNGYFVELGANDGVSQSNTYYFETQRHWRGLLIEPVLHNFLKCKSNRSTENAFACAACVSFAYAENQVRLVYSNLMTAPIDLQSDIADPRAHAEAGRVYLGNGESPVEILAPAKTLSALLDEARAPRVIDLLSLDVEGAEIEVLKGIDHLHYRFRHILIESRDERSITDYLSGYGYQLIDKLSNHDYLYAETMRKHAE